jgi:hypothetical protein
MGNIVANGTVEIKSAGGSQQGAVTGTASIPVPTSGNYTGPVPGGGFSNNLQLPVLPPIPENTPFDTKAGATDISNSQTITPGAYRTLTLTGNKTVTFSGVGNYIFSNVNNTGTNNQFVFDFRGAASGTINIYIVKDAIWGKIFCKMMNGGSPSRIYTEVHGTGALNGGNAFDLADGSPNSPTGVYNWLGSVWAPNGGISIC